MNLPSKTLLSIFYIAIFISSSSHTMEDDDSSLSLPITASQTPDNTLERHSSYFPSTQSLLSIQSLLYQGYVAAGPTLKVVADRSVQTAKEFTQTPATTFFNKMQKRDFDTLIAAGDTRSVVSATEKAFRHKFEPSTKISDLQQPRNQQRIAAIIQELQGLKQRTRAEIFLNQTLAQEYIPLQEQAQEEKLHQIALSLHPEIAATFQIDLDECVSNFLDNYAQLYHEYQQATRSCLDETKTIAANLRYLYACAPNKHQSNSLITSPAHYESLESYENLLTIVQKKAKSTKTPTCLTKIDLAQLLEKLNLIEESFEQEQRKTSLNLLFPESFDTEEKSEGIDAFTEESIATVMKKSDLANHHHQASLAKLLAKKMQSIESDQSTTMQEYQEKQAKIYAQALCAAHKKIDQEKQRWNSVNEQVKTILDKKMTHQRLKLRQIAANTSSFDQLAERESGLPNRLSSFDTHDGFEYMLTRYTETLQKK